MKLIAFFICIVVALQAPYSSAETYDTPALSIQKLNLVSEDIDYYIEGADSAAKRVEFSNAKREVDRIVSSAENLQDVLSDAKERVNSDVDEQVEEVNKGFAEWAARRRAQAKASSANSTIKDEIETLIANLESAVPTKIVDCKKELVSGVNDYETNIRKALQNSRQKADSLNTKAESCANSKSRLCTSNVRRARTTLHNTSLDFTKLRLEGKKIERSGVTSTACHRAISHEQSDVDIQISSLLES